MCRQNPHLWGLALLQWQSSNSSLVRASDRNSKDPGSNPGWISSGCSSFSALAHLLNKYISCCHDGGKSYTIAISTLAFYKLA